MTEGQRPAISGKQQAAEGGGAAAVGVFIGEALRAAVPAAEPALVSATVGLVAVGLPWLLSRLRDRRA